MSELVTKSVAQEQQEQKIETRTAVERIAGFTIVATAVAVLAVLAAAALLVQGQDKDKYSLKSPGAIAFSDFRGYEDWAVVSSARTDEVLKVIVRQSDHDRGVQGRRSQQRPAFHRWLHDREAPVEAEEEHGGPLRRGRARRLYSGFRQRKGQQEISEKRGWDTRYSTMKLHRTSSRPIPKPLRLRARVPYGREGEGLHLPPVREALTREGPDTKYPANRMSRCEALFSTWIPVSCGKCSQLHSRLLPERIWACKI
jgi:hypothetical protein